MLSIIPDTQLSWVISFHNAWALDSISHIFREVYSLRCDEQLLYGNFYLPYWLKCALYFYFFFLSFLFGTLNDKSSLWIMQSQSLSFFKQCIKIFFSTCPDLFRHLLCLSPFLHSHICLMELVASSFSISSSLNFESFSYISHFCSKWTTVNFIVLQYRYYLALLSYLGHAPS